MRTLLASPRRRRRLMWLGVVLLIGLAVAILGILYPNTGKKEKETFSNEPAAVAAPEPKQVTPPRGAEMTKALETAALFVKKAVLRQDPEGSWDLSTPALRQGDARAVWSTGTIPVVPYPQEDLARVQWRIDFSYKNRLGLGVLMMPKRQSQLSPLAFQMELIPRGSGKSRRWLVDSWVPSGVGLMQSSSPVRGQDRPQAVGSGGSALSARWLLAPLAIVGLLVLLPIALALRGWYRASRAEREYRARPLSG